MTPFGLRSAALAALVLAGTSSLAYSQTSVSINNFDGTFENGKPFDSGYTYVNPITAFSPGGQQNTNVNSSQAGQYFDWQGLPAQAGTKALYADGASVANTVVWGTTVTGLNAQTDYTFSFYGAAISNRNFAQLAVLLDGVQKVVLSTTYNTWQQASFTFNTGAATSARFTIRDNNLGSDGNDFGVDSIFLRAVPGPIAGAGIPALFGLAGLGLWRRSRKTA